MAWYKITYSIISHRQALLNGRNFESAMGNFAKKELIEDKKVKGVLNERVLETVVEIQPGDYPKYNIPCIVTEGG